jgi:transposase
VPILLKNPILSHNFPIDFRRRPSIDPELVIRMLFSYCYGIRSEQRLCDEINMNLAYRWFFQLGLEDAIPDHSSFLKIVMAVLEKLIYAYPLPLVTVS